MNKKTLLDFLEYLKNFSQLRYIPVADIESNKSQYEEIIWFSEIPNNKFISHIFSQDNNKHDYLLKIKKPEEPIKPSFNITSTEINKWAIIHETDTSISVDLKRSIMENGKEVSLENMPNILDIYTKYIDTTFKEEKEKYEVALANYKTKHEVYTRSQQIYRKLFTIANKREKFPEEYQLVLAIGLFSFRNPQVQIYRHILTQQISISHSFINNHSEIIIQVNNEELPQVETDFIRHYSDLFDSHKLSEVSNKLTTFFQPQQDEEYINDLTTLEEDKLGEFISQLHPDGLFQSIISKSKREDNHLPLLTYSPAIIFRRNNTRNLINLYQKIIDQVDLCAQTPENFNILTSKNSHKEPSPEEEYSVDPIYFPKDYNDEQENTLYKIKDHQAVLVKGPPGTGKSHTISNLISHYLATNKKILVTAYTQRALEVLKDKIPEEIRELTVSYLNNDTQSKADLTKSINLIIDKTEKENLSSLKKQIKKNEKVLESNQELLEKSYEDYYDLQRIIYLDQNLNFQYRGKISEIAKKIRDERQIFSWYKDTYHDYDNNDKQNILKRTKVFFNKNQEFIILPQDDLLDELPNESLIIPLEELKKYHSIKNQLKNDYENYEISWTVESEKIENLYNLACSLQKSFQVYTSINFDYKEEILNFFNSNSLNQLEERIRNTKDILKDIQTNQNYFQKEKKSIQELKIFNNERIEANASILLEYFKQDTNLRSLFFKLQRPFFPKYIKSVLKTIDSFNINNRPCTYSNDIVVFKKYLSIKISINNILKIWGINPSNIENLNIAYKIQFLKNHLEKTIEIKNSFTEIKRLLFEIYNTNGVPSLQLNTEDINSFMKDITYLSLANKLQRINEKTDSAIEYLSANQLHIVKQDLIDSLRTNDIQLYDTSLKKLRQLALLQEEYQAFLQEADALREYLPHLIDDIFSENITINHIKQLSKAFILTEAQVKLADLIADNNVQNNRLKEDIKRAEIRKKDITKSLINQKSWANIINKLRNDRELSISIKDWVASIEKMGKSPKSQSYKKYSSIAREKMEKCKEVVPCWIMPLYKVAETINPHHNMFDIIIIDEASQLGPEALFLFYITKKIVIVGDDKQTSPEYVGVNTNSMDEDLNRLLANDLHRENFNIGNSLFDIGKIYCPASVSLREHFRCMPEIIEFSNSNYYRPDDQTLYPLKQFSEKRLSPLESHYCPNAFVEGDKANIHNDVEAQAIVNKIASLIKLDEYQKKTFGVIVLQGTSQAEKIEQLLLQFIPEDEIINRKIVCGNSASFQGDERDVIMLSLVTAPNHRRSALTKNQDKRRFNVAGSRAKEQLWIFHSVELKDLLNQEDQRYLILHHIMNYQSKNHTRKDPVINYGTGASPLPFSSWFETEVYNLLVQNSIPAIPKYSVVKDKYIIDLVAVASGASKIAIDCFDLTSQDYHLSEVQQKEKIVKNVKQARVLSRCGWIYIQIKDYEFYMDQDQAITPLEESINQIEEDYIQLTKQTNVLLSKRFRILYLDNQQIFEYRIVRKISESSIHDSIIKINFDSPLAKTIMNAKKEEVLYIIGTKTLIKVLDIY